jgi:fatty-acid desaturase
MFAAPRYRVQKVMIITGLILLLLGMVLGIPLLWTLGVILLIVGVVLMIVGSAGHQIGGRAHYW